MDQIEITYHRFSRKKEFKVLSETTEIVDLSGMDIFDIDLSQVAEMKNLKAIKLSNNKLESITLPEFLPPSIESLDFSDNKILHLDSTSFAPGKRLKELRLRGNLLKEAPLGEFHNCLDLELLDISNNHIHTIDLEKIGHCMNLRTLNLSHNQLNEIDLSPIREAENLQTVNLSHNWIREIDTQFLSNKPHLTNVLLNENPLTQFDLSFVRTCPSLEVLLLDWTKLSQLDISPLTASKNLKKLGIAQNKSVDLNLFSLTACEKLESLNISGIEPNSIDIWPLFGMPHLSDLTISQRLNINSFPFSSLVWPRGLDQIRNRQISGGQLDELRAKDFGDVKERYLKLRMKLNSLAQFHLDTAFIEFYDLGYLRGYDGNLVELIDGIEDDSTFENTQTLLASLLSEGIIQQVQTGGSTHFLNMDHIRSHPVLAVIASDVIASRTKELDCISLIESEGAYETIELWYTVYGQEILSALGIGLVTDKMGVNRIQTEFEKVGLDITHQIRDCSSWDAPSLSDELKAYLRFLAIRNSL